jgi:hypothetical protein
MNILEIVPAHLRHTLGSQFANCARNGAKPSADSLFTRIEEQLHAEAYAKARQSAVECCADFVAAR